MFANKNQWAKICKYLSKLLVRMRRLEVMFFFKNLVPEKFPMRTDIIHSETLYDKMCYTMT